jgi:hypothetical protein
MEGSTDCPGLNSANPFTYLNETLVFDGKTYATFYGTSYLKWPFSRVPRARFSVQCRCIL